MEKVKNEFSVSGNIAEISQWHKIEAERLVEKLQSAHQEEGLISLDCAPGGNKLNPFHYNNGRNDAGVVKSLAGSFLGDDLAWLEEKIALSSRSAFKTDYAIGEKLALWQRVRPNDYQQKIDWSHPFCVKHENGASRIWHPNRRQLGYNNNLSTVGAIKEFIFSDTSYLQKFFIPPIAENNQSIIFRLIFICQKNKTPEMIAGLWISRPGFKVYPDKKATVGLISPLATTVEIF